MLLAPFELLVVGCVGSFVDVQGSAEVLHSVALADVVVAHVVSPVRHGSTATEHI